MKLFTKQSEESAFPAGCSKCFRYAIDQPNGNYVVETAKPTGWVHAVMVYHGVEQGISAYQDGIKVGTDTSRNPFQQTQWEWGSGHWKKVRRPYTPVPSWMRLKCTTGNSHRRR